MYKLANVLFANDEKLMTKEKYYFTELMKSEVRSYFKIPIEGIDHNHLVGLMDLRKIRKLLDKPLNEEISELGYNVDVFVGKKLIQLYNILKKDEELVPDLFIEYLVYKLISNTQNFDYKSPECILSQRQELMSEVEKYIIDNWMDFFYDDEIDGTLKLSEDDVKKMALVKSNNICLSLTSLDAIDNLCDDDSSVFWDLDFLFFEEKGFVNTLKFLTFGGFDYNHEYMKNIFEDINLPVPYGFQLIIDDLFKQFFPQIVDIKLDFENKLNTITNEASNIIRQDMINNLLKNDL